MPVKELSPHFEFASWRVPQFRRSIEYPLEVMEEIRAFACDELLQLSHGGDEVGGVLFGTRQDDSIRVLTWRPMACEHSKGESLHLSYNDRMNLAVQLEVARKNPDLKDLRPVGWFVSHLRGSVSLSDSDLEIYNGFFPESWQTALVICHKGRGSAQAGFFMREADGKVQSEASYQCFELAPGPVTDGTKMAGTHLPEVGAPQPPAVKPKERGEGEIARPLSTPPRDLPGTTSQAAPVPVPHLPAPAPASPASSVQVQRIEDPAVQAPASQVPAVQAPHLQTPASATSTVQFQPTQTPALQAPASQVPSIQAPHLQTPASATSAVQSPPVQAPASQAPVVQAPHPQSPASSASNVHTHTSDAPHLQAPPLRPPASQAPSVPVRPRLPPASPASAFPARPIQAPSFQIEEQIPTRERWFWAIPILLALGIAVFMLYQRRAPSSNESMAFRASSEGQTVQLAWDAKSPAIRDSFRGEIEIEDGSKSSQVSLTSDQLHAGKMSYSRQSGDVGFALTVYPAHGDPIHDSTRLIAPAFDAPTQPPQLIPASPVAATPVSAAAAPADQSALQQQLQRLREELSKERAHDEELQNLVRILENRLGIPAEPARSASHR